MGSVPQEPSIFVHTFELFKDVAATVRQFPKPSRYVLGCRLESCCIDFVVALNAIVGPSGIRHPEDKEKALRELLRQLDAMRLFVRMADETGAVSAGTNERIVGRLQEIGRELGGLLKSVQRG